MTAPSEIYQRWALPLRAFLRTKGLSDADVDDLSQETWARFFAHPEYLFGHHGAIVFTIAKNLFRNRYRSSLGAMRALSALNLWQAELQPEPRLAARAELGRVRGELRDLGALDAEVFGLRAVGGLDYRSIARIVGLSEASVRKRVSRVRKRLSEATRDGGR